MFVVVGLPVVPGPSADVTVMPSLVIDAIFFLSAFAMLTEKCSATLPPASMTNQLMIDVEGWRPVAGNCS